MATKVKVATTSQLSNQYLFVENELDMYISYNPCREMTDILQQQLSQFVCTVANNNKKKKTSGSRLLITYRPTAY